MKVPLLYETETSELCWVDTGSYRGASVVLIPIGVEQLAVRAEVNAYSQFPSSHLGRYLAEILHKFQDNSSAVGNVVTSSPSVSPTMEETQMLREHFDKANRTLETFANRIGKHEKAIDELIPAKFKEFADSMTKTCELLEAQFNSMELKLLKNFKARLERIHSVADLDTALQQLEDEITKNEKPTTSGPNPT